MLEFIPDTHQYLIDGVIVPSVTQIIQQIFPDKYKGISKRTLDNKAKFGTEGHAIIESLDVTNMGKAMGSVLGLSNKDLQICLREYLRLVNRRKIKPKRHEMMVHYKDIYAGTLDMIADVDGVESLIDIKFTASLDEEYLQWQLGMYELAYGSFAKHYCLWLPKGNLGQLIEIEPKTKAEILGKLEELGYV